MDPERLSDPDPGQSVSHDQARRLGYESRMVGVVGHCVNVVIVPTDKGVIQRWPAGG